MSGFIYHNGNIIKSEMPIVPAANRGLRYGDGLFETMKLVEGKLELEAYHFERLFSGMEKLLFTIPPQMTRVSLTESILQLAIKNNVQKLARVRLMIVRGNGSLFDFTDYLPICVIEATSLDPSVQQFNERGLNIDIYPDARKSVDKFSSLKTNNFLPYVMAAFFSKSQNLDDAIILNSHNQVCDSSIANVFIIKDGIITTPALETGCIAGVMRRKVLELGRGFGFTIKESVLYETDLLDADEVFLSNSTYGLRWVKQMRDKIFTNELTLKFYNFLVTALAK